MDKLRETLVFVIEEHDRINTDLEHVCGIFCPIYIIVELGYLIRVTYSKDLSLGILKAVGAIINTFLSVICDISDPICKLVFVLAYSSLNFKVFSFSLIDLTIAGAKKCIFLEQINDTYLRICMDGEQTFKFSYFSY